MSWQGLLLRAKLLFIAAVVAGARGAKAQAHQEVSDRDDEKARQIECPPSRWNLGGFLCFICAGEFHLVPKPMPPGQDIRLARRCAFRTPGDAGQCWEGPPTTREGLSRRPPADPVDVHHKDSRGPTRSNDQRPARFGRAQNYFGGLDHRRDGTRAIKIPLRIRRVALPGGIVARRPIVAAVAFSCGRRVRPAHRAQVRDLLPDHLKRHPNRSLAAFAPDPRIAGGLELGNGAGVGTWRCNQSAVRPARQIILGVGPGTAATTADRGPPVHAPAGFCHSQERSLACLIVFSREHVPACRTRGGRDVNCQEASRAQRFSGEC